MRYLLAALALAACSPAQAPSDAPSTEPQAVAPATTGAPATTLAGDAPLAIIMTPARGARITSPLHIAGVAPAGWYFENQFPVRLVDARGQTIAQAPAHPDVNWTENAEQKAFALDLPFTVSSETAAELVLQEDMPAEGQPPREVRIAVVLVPS